MIIGVLLFHEAIFVNLQNVFIHLWIREFWWVLKFLTYGLKTTHFFQNIVKNWHSDSLQFWFRTMWFTLIGQVSKTVNLIVYVNHQLYKLMSWKISKNACLKFKYRIKDQSEKFLSIGFLWYFLRNFEVMQWEQLFSIWNQQNWEELLHPGSMNQFTTSCKYFSRA